MNTKDLLELAQEVGISENTSVKDLLGLQLEIPEMIFQINIGKYRLAVTFGGKYPQTIQKYRGNIYTLNIEDDDPHAQFKWEGDWAKELITRQLTNYISIIQEFMIQSLMGTLK